MKYLTKSRFKLAMECPTKLYYYGKPEYANMNLENSFLASLAEGGFQVGELARRYFPGGYLVDEDDHQGALALTKELMDHDRVTIYEAALAHNDLFVRVDILVKDGDHVEIIEVKAKSCSKNTESEFVNRKDEIASGWKPYLLDVAFQKLVAEASYPALSFSAYLMMADKDALCPTDGLNQKFRIKRGDDGAKATVLAENLTPEDLSVPILRKISVDPYCQMLWKERFSTGSEDLVFADYVQFLAKHNRKGEKIQAQPSSICKKCEFDASRDELESGLNSGYKECWKSTLGWGDEDFEEPTVLDIWDFRKKDKMMQEKRIKISQIRIEDIDPKTGKGPGLSRTQRQWMQVEKSAAKDGSFWIDRENLAREMESWMFPLHFIDFETSAVAIPFNKGRHPYEGIAFQFSHHMVHEDGTIEHAGEYLNAESGVFPNYDFVRNLKEQLTEDSGTIFRYAPHENTYLNMIYWQIKGEGKSIEDGEDLCSFIQSISHSGNKSPIVWKGDRDMVDMWDLVKRYYYDPATNGSNSIKQVLPAMLASSTYLQEKYAKPIYGAKNGIRSKNYKDWRWIDFDREKVKDPYKLLPPLFQDVSMEKAERISGMEQLQDGGAALTAYARMQFEEMAFEEREALKNALLKYCELDTMAMVMIYEGWREMLAR